MVWRAICLPDGMNTDLPALFNALHINEINVKSFQLYRVVKETLALLDYLSKGYIDEIYVIR